MAGGTIGVSVASLYLAIGACTGMVTYWLNEWVLERES